MEENQTSPIKSVSNGAKKHTARIVLTMALIAALIVGGALGGYWLGHGSSKRVPSAQIAANSQNTSTPVNSATSTVHFVASLGYPLNQPSNTYKYTTKLGVPDFMQAVRIWSNNHNRGAEQAYTNEYNNELGRWVLGNPSDGQDNGAGTSEVSLLAISNDWLMSTGDTDFSWQYGSPLQTPAQKKQFLDNLVASTTSCAKDASKGFTTSDDKLNICYTYSYGKDGYAPTISLSGYGTVQNQPLYFTGFVMIHDDSVGSDFNAQHDAIGNANAGHPPAKTAQAQKAILDAIKRTTITATPR